MSSKLGSLVNISQRKVSAALITLENYISTENMLPNCGGVTCVSSIPEGVQKIPGYEVGETLFSNIRTYFRKVWYADKDGTCSPDVLVFAAKDKNQINDHFLYYLLSNFDFIEYTDKTAKGAKMPRGDKDAIKNYEFECPSLRVQIKIANLLGSLDDRITLLRETSKTLEAIAQAMFKSWFIDFDPVRAKRQGRIPTGMNEETAALFPDELVESELGLIPKGWKVGTLADLSNLNPESWVARKKPHRLMYVDLANAKENVILEIVEYEFDKAPSRAKRVLRSGDTIIGTVRPGNRSFAFIWQPVENLTGSTGFAVLRPGRVENTEYVYLAATQKTSIEQLAHLADGGAYPAVRPEVVAQLSCVIPGEAVMQSFHGVVDVLLQKISTNQQQSQTLTELRDTLLPRLISGKLRIADAELEEHT